MVDKAVIRFYALGIATLSLSLAAVAFLFGVLLHENGHAIACILFGRAYSWSLTQVVYETSPDPLVNTVMGLAGGATQALFAFIFFWYATFWEKRFLFKSIFDMKRSPKLSMVFGFEATFLTVAFHGVANAIWEGLFYEHYSLNYKSVVLTGAIILASLIVSLGIIYIRYRRLTVSK